MTTARRTFLASAAALAAIGASAQAPAKARRIGYVSFRAGIADYDRAFVTALRERGYVEGRDVAIDYRFAAGDPATLDRMIVELIASKPDLIVVGGPATRSVAKATTTIPIVAIVADPVAQGLAASLSRPGGNLTGVTLQSIELAHKRLQLLREIVPTLRRVGALVIRTSAGPDPVVRDAAIALVAEATSAARPLGIAIVTGEVLGGGDLGEAFARFRRERTQALIVQLGPLTYDFRHTIFALAAEARLPALYETRNYVDEGGLMSYGPDLGDAFRRVAGYVDRILRGAKPGQLAIEQPGRYELAINLPTAAAIGVAIPQPVLLRADALIR